MDNKIIKKMNNCNKIKNTCAESLYSTCVDYQGILGESTKINTPCVTIHDVVEDLYTITDKIESKIDFTEVGSNCLTYLGEKTLKKIILRYESEICNLKSKLANLEDERLCDVSITGCNLNLGNLTDICDEPIVTFKGLMQAMLDQINLNTQ